MPWEMWGFLFGLHKTHSCKAPPPYGPSRNGCKGVRSTAFTVPSLFWGGIVERDRTVVHAVASHYTSLAG